MGLILFFIAYVLFLPMTFINFLTVRKEGYFRSTAVNIDIFANREFRATWNKHLISFGGYKFGKEGETISSALGKNKKQGTLSKKGQYLCNILDLIEKDHCIKSINYL